MVAEPKSPAATQANAILPSKPSIDQVAATSLAADLAAIADLPISSNVANRAISLNTKSELAQNDEDTISKPQIIQPSSAVARGVTTYKTQTGDTADTVAKEFKLNKDTIKWSNDMQSDALEPGRDIVIAPVDGLVSAAQPGDTIASLAQKYKTDPERIVLYNEIDASATIEPGIKVVIPGGVMSAVPPAPTSTSAVNGRQNNSVNISAILATGNRYDYGYCTWYAYNRRAALGKQIGGLWGDASSWAALARSNGFSVNNKPEVGAVLQTPSGGYGHVAVVESIGADGSVFISEMNYAGWNVKSTRTISASQVGTYNYIH